MPDLDQELELTIREKPWLHPELPPDSWWVVTSEEQAAWIVGTHGTGRSTLIGTLCHVSYAGGSAVFIASSAADTIAVSPGHVAHAFQVLLVRADDPHRAAYHYDQDEVDEAFRRCP